MTEIILNNLPPEHELCNRPLQGMYHRNKGTKAWKEIKGNYGIRKATFNQLSKGSMAGHDRVCLDRKGIII